MEKILETMASAVRAPRSRLRGREASRKKVDKHFRIEVTDEDIPWSKRQEKIGAEAQLDGIYVIWTSLAASAIDAGEAVEAYEGLSQVERAFLSLKTMELALRPVFVYSEAHVRGHVFLCLLAYYLEWHLSSVWRRCCSRRKIGRGRERCVGPRWKRRRSPSVQRPRPPASERPTGFSCTVSRHCWRTSARSP